MATRKQRTGLSKPELHALAKANNVDYKADTTNPDLEDLIEAKGVNLQSAEEAGDPASAKASGTPLQTEGHEDEDMTLVQSPSSQSGTAPVTGRTAHRSDAEPEASSGTPEALGADELLADDNLDDIDTGRLMGVKAIIDRVLDARGAPTTASTPATMLEQAKDVPVFAGEYDLSLADAAKVKGLQPPMPEGVAPFGFHIRQAADQHTNTPYGPKYVVVIDENGGKHAAEL